MCSVKTFTTAILSAATVFGVLGAAPARASKDDVPINGTYRATTIGDWSKTNDQFHHEPAVVSTWRISSSCTTYEECTGTVTSDQGWSEPTYTHDGGVWYVKHDVPNWERCPDGVAYTGRQIIYFYQVNDEGQPQLGSPVMAGKDKTIGPSGACGQNQPLAIEAPFRLDKIG